jgi:hypothetical protein
MSNDKKYSKSSREDFLRYLGGKLSERERNRIERKLMSHPFEQEAMEGFAEISADEVRKDLEIMDQKVFKRASGKKTFVWYRLAAVVAVLMAISITFITVFDDRIGQLNRNVAETETEPDDKKMERSGEAVVITETTEDDYSPAPVESRVEEVNPEISEVLIMEDKDISGISEDLIEETVEETIEENIEEKSEEVMSEEFAMEAVSDVMEAEILEIEPEAEIPDQPISLSQSRARATADAPSAKKGGARMISGTIVSGEDNQPLPGVSILLKETGTGVMSDRSGNFNLSVNEDTPNTLIANYIGMKTREVSINEESEMEIVLEPDPVSLNEIVIVGYGVKSRDSQTGAVSTLDFSENENSSEYKSAEPIIGRDAFKSYIEENIRFPEDSELNRGVVILNFSIGLDGRPGNITTLRSPAESLTQEAIRLLNEGPDWKPAEGVENPDDQSTRIRIVFRK